MSTPFYNKTAHRKLRRMCTKQAVGENDSKEGALDRHPRGPPLRVLG